MEVEQAAASASQPDLVSILRATRTKELDLSEREREILDLWDQAEELRLESSLLEAQASAQPLGLAAISGDNIQEQLTTAEREVLEARALYTLRQTIIRNVLLVDPVLKAVHGGTHAHALEERLLPYINERDVLAMLHSTVTAKAAKARTELSKAEQRSMSINQTNQELAQTVLELAAQLKDHAEGEVEDDELRAELEAADREVRVARRKWRVMKSIAAGMVVGSGVDWASDGRLMELVMDDDDDGLG